MTANNLGTVCALILPTACYSSSALHAVRHGRQLTGTREASPNERACAATPLSDPSSHTTIYNTHREASHLIAGLVAQFEQSLTHTAGKCDSQKPVTNADSPFRSVKHPYRTPTA